MVTKHDYVPIWQAVPARLASASLMVALSNAVRRSYSVRCNNSLGVIFLLPARLPHRFAKTEARAWSMEHRAPSTEHRRFLFFPGRRSHPGAKCGRTAGHRPYSVSYIFWPWSWSHLPRQGCAPLGPRQHPLCFLPSLRDVFLRIGLPRFFLDHHCIGESASLPDSQFDSLSALSGVVRRPSIGRLPGGVGSPSTQSLSKYCVPVDSRKRYTAALLRSASRMGCRHPLQSL